ncbi:MAG: hypothetical protein JNJ71_17405, partial [Rubrivivax sp.]|nr:hypothetical protein [Rubrivivax sp.]
MRAPKRSALAWLAAAWAVGMLGCSPRAAEPDLRALATAAASEIHAALPPQRPGFGITDYPGNAAGDVPKSYAMVLLAELERRGRAWRAGETDLTRVAGEWLLANADNNGDGVIGWGLPVAWDAYDDGSTNPAHTEYTITTAIVVDALLTWAERDARAPRERIREVVHAAVRPYLDPGIASPSGMAPYSLATADRRYDTFNPAAYLAGQIQRASLRVFDPGERERYLAAADATMHALLRHRQLAPVSGHWYWNYSVQQALPNDLPHAGYMIAGVRAYMEHGGRLADRFDWYAVLHHLEDFRGDAGEVRAFPNFRKGLKLAARSYDLGFALHLACTETRAEPLVRWLMAALEGYRTPAARYLKYPRSSASAPGATPPLIVNEYEAYLYRGLTSCALAPRAAAASATAETRLVGSGDTATLASQLAAAAGGPGPATPGQPRAMMGPAVPLLPASAGIVAFDNAGQPTLTREQGHRLSINVPGVPVKVLVRDAATFVFLRRHPDNALSLLRYERDRLVCRIDVEHGRDTSAVASLRAATLQGHRLHAVAYHNPSQANWYLAWDVTPACPVSQGETVQLPSLQEPAGS